MNSLENNVGRNKPSGDFSDEKNNQPKQISDSISSVQPTFDLISFLLGGGLYGSASAAIIIVLLETISAPTQIAYVFLVVLIIMLLVMTVYWTKRRSISRKVVGTDLKTINQVIDGAKENIIDGDINNLLVRAQEGFAIYLNVRTRNFALKATGGVVAAIAVMLTAGFLIKQIKAMNDQTEAIKLQTAAFTKLDTLQPFWDVHHSEDSDTRTIAFTKLINKSVWDFNGISLKKVNLTNNGVFSIQCYKCKFEQLNIFGKDMRNVRFSRSEIKFFRIQDSDLRGSDFTDVKLITLSDFDTYPLIPNKFRSYHFYGSNLEGVDFSMASLSGIDFEGVISIENINFEYSEINYVKFPNELSFEGVNFEGTNFYDVEFGNSRDTDDRPIDLSGIKSLDGTIFEKVTFINAILVGLNFTDIKASKDIQDIHYIKGSKGLEDLKIFKGLNFINSNLQNSNFDGLILQGVKFTGSDITGATFTESKDLNLEGAILNNFICPKGGLSVCKNAMNDDIVSM